MLSSKISASRVTTSDTKLFTIRLEVFKATNINIEHIILITDSPSFAKRAIDLSVYSGQAYSLTIYSKLRSFFSGSLSYKIEF